MRGKNTDKVNNIVVISDTHFGCRFALCPPEIKLDGGAVYRASKMQRKLWNKWEEFWFDWVKVVTRDEPFILVHNGDIIEGSHHNSVTMISNNMEDQKRIAVEVIGHVLKNTKCVGYYQIRGTEAHSGRGSEYEESIARELGAIKAKNGLHSRYELLLRLHNKRKIHFTHHMSHTRSLIGEATPVHRELVEIFSEYGKYGLVIPDVVVRSHRHRYIKIEVERYGNYAIAVTTPCWQLKTPYVYRLSFARISFPQIGGIVIRAGDEDQIYTRAKVWGITDEGKAYEKI